MLSALLKQQLAGQDYLPDYGYHVTDSIVTLDDNRVMFSLSCEGVPFEAVSDARLQSDYDSLNTMLLGLAKSTGNRLGVWFHHDHFKTTFDTNYRFEYRWMEDFASRYIDKFESNDYFENKYYLTFILKSGDTDELVDTIKEMTEIQIGVLQMLYAYEPQLLKTYQHNGYKFSELYEFIGYLYNGYWERIPVTSMRLRDAVGLSTHYHGHKLIETRYPDKGHCFNLYYDQKDMPERIKGGNCDPLLDLPFEFVLCHSLSVINQTDSVYQINQALNKMESAGDEAHEQMEDMEKGKSALMSGEIMFGEYHSALMVRGSTEKQTEDYGAIARSRMLGSCGCTYVPATMSAPETFFSFFPGAFKSRPRVSPRTTRVALGMFSMDTFSSGKHYGNPVGDGSAVIPLQTSAHGVYHFNWHHSLPDIDARGEMIAGHTHICGVTGSGKTVLQTVFLTFTTRFKATNGTPMKVFGLDKDGSMRGFIEAAGGTYFNLRAGEPTGLNPFQLPDTQQNRDFLMDLVAACGRDDNGDLTPEDIKDIKIAVDNNFSIPFEHRRFGMITQTIPDRGPACLTRRLAKWCYHESGNGRYAYALDNPKNNFDWEKLERVGIDVSDFLVADHPATEPILSYLLHLKKLMQQGGGLMATVVEEYWLPLSYPTTAAQIFDALKTGRRKGEFVVLVTQSPEDAAKSALLPAILQQTPTKIYLPNPDAEYTGADGSGGYKAFGLSDKEFKLLKSLGMASRRFIIKQGSQTNVAKLDLNGMSDVMSVLAMAAEDFKYLEEAKRRMGEHPDEWVPMYKKLRLSDRKQKAVASLTTEGN
ncbi:MAG: hypothetical protein PHF20_01265 [Halothiobacillaceae bacterium]|nr:hypothetical protein [Halothiobacillaceae bacterium]